jgi:hypothetical protein
VIGYVGAPAADCAVEPATRTEALHTVKSPLTEDSAFVADVGV